MSRVDAILIRGLRRRQAGTKVAATLFATAVSAIAFFALSFPASAAAQRCGRVNIPTRHTTAKVRVVHGAATCSSARKLIKAAYHAVDTRQADGYGNTYGYFWRVSGWRCYFGLGRSEALCQRRGNQVDGSTRTDDGWGF